MLRLRVLSQVSRIRVSCQNAARLLGSAPKIPNDVEIDEDGRIRAPVFPVDSRVLYSWGRAADGRLGHGWNKFNQSTPKKVLELEDKGVIKVAAGRQHSAAITGVDNYSKSIFVWGNAKYGQVGVGRTSLQSWIAWLFGGANAPQQLLLQGVTDVALGDWHSAAITDDGYLYTWGSGQHGRLGHGSEQDHFIPYPVETLKSGPGVKKVACGGAYTAVLTKNGEVFTWGRGDKGQLGHGDTIAQFVPKQVDKLKGVKIIDIACGGEHMIALSNDGEVYTWGCSDDGRTGLGMRMVFKTDDITVPRKVKFFEKKPVTQVAAGSKHSVALSATGEVFTWGSGWYGQLGHGGQSNVHAPRCVEDLIPYDVAKIVCGGHNTHVVTAHGQLLTWGRGAFGQLGYGVWGVVSEPTVVTEANDLFVLDAAVGDEHAMMVAVPRSLLKPSQTPTAVPQPTPTTPAPVTTSTSTPNATTAAASPVQDAATAQPAVTVTATQAQPQAIPESAQHKVAK